MFHMNNENPKSRATGNGSQAAGNGSRATGNRSQAAGNGSRTAGKESCPDSRTFEFLQIWIHYNIGMEMRKAPQAAGGRQASRS